MAKEAGVELGKVEGAENYTVYTWLKLFLSRLRTPFGFFVCSLFHILKPLGEILA